MSKLFASLAIFVIILSNGMAAFATHATCGTDTCAGYTGCGNSPTCQSTLQDGANGFSIACLNCDQYSDSNWVTSEWLERDCYTRCAELVSEIGIDGKSKLVWTVKENTTSAVCWLNFNFTYGECCGGCG